MMKTNNINDLNLLDRFLFAQASEDTEFMELILSIILDSEITLQEQPQPEKEQRKKLSSKQVKLDVMAMDDYGNVYDAEVQKVNRDNLPKRIRYYHGMIDGNLLPPGNIAYEELNDVYVIMIAPFDMFGKGLYKYTFRMTCEEIPGMGICDGSTTIILNTRGTDKTGVSDELVELLEYFEHTENEVAEASESTRIHTIQKKINTIRSSEEIGVRYMLEWEEKEFARQEGREEGWFDGREEGREEGRSEEKNSIALAMLKNGIAPETVASCTGLTVERIHELMK